MNMGMNIVNCPRCGKIFARGIREICPACTKDIELEYETCVKYLRENKGATIHDVSNETKVSVKQITKFLKEGRISLYNMPNLGYPCEVCGIMVREGGMCDDCRKRLAKDVNNINEQDRLKKEELLRQRQALTYKTTEKK